MSDVYNSDISVHGTETDSEHASYVRINVESLEEDAGSEAIDPHASSEVSDALERGLEGLRMHGSADVRSREEERRIRHAHFETSRRPRHDETSERRTPSRDSGVGSLSSKSSVSLPDCTAEDDIATVLVESGPSDSVIANRWNHEGGEDTATRLDVEPPIRVNIELCTSDQASVLAHDGSGARPAFQGTPGKKFVRVKTPAGLTTLKEMEGAEEPTPLTPSRMADSSEREARRKERMKKMLEEKKQGIEELNRHIRLAQSVDVCFMVDSTGSMQGWIDAVKQNIQALYDRIQKVYKKSCHMRAAFVAYTDFDKPEGERHKVFPFSLYPKQFYEYVNNVRADGGGDTAEDIMGAFHEMFSKLQWRDGVTKLLIHIADAPCHGQQYHGGVNDQHKEGDPNGRSHDSMMQMMARKNIQYFFGKINDSTDKMVGIFDQCLQRYSGGDLSITTFDAATPTSGDFLSHLETAVKCSVQHSMAASHGKTERGEARVMDKTQPKDYHGMKDHPGTAIRFHMPKSIEELLAGTGLQIDKYKVNIRMAEKPFAKGSARLAYHGVETIHRKRVVVKCSKFSEIIYNRYKRHLEDAEMQTVAAKLLSDFKKALRPPHKDRFKMHMIVSKVVSFDNAASEGDKYMSMEPLLPPADYEKFTNNYDVQPSDTPFLETLQALSHWSWVASKERMMLVDLQGVPKDGVIYLTDPAIHCKDLLKFGYGTNLGVQGMIKFFEAHECNAICKSFGFKPNPMT